MVDQNQLMIQGVKGSLGELMFQGIVLNAQVQALQAEVSELKAAAALPRDDKGRFKPPKE